MPPSDTTSNPGTDASNARPPRTDDATRNTDAARTVDAASVAPTAPSSRRRFLRAAAWLATTIPLAGCTTGGGGRIDGGDGTPSVEEWLADAGNFDGIVDRTGTSTVAVEVGPEGDEMVFAPAGVRIRPGTTVEWTWIGSGHHNVVAEDDRFSSGDPESGASFEYTFDAAGTTLYYCDPHRSAGMKGAVVVEEASASEGTESETETGT